MQQMPICHQINKILSVCKKHSILTAVISDNSIKALDFGPLGNELRRNILKEWWSSIFGNSDINMFSIMPPRFHDNGGKESAQFFRESLLDATLHHYVSALSLVGKCLPFGLAQSGQCTLDKKTSEIKAATGVQQILVGDNSEIHENTPIWNPMEWTSLSVVFFCPPKKSMHWFHYWQRQRYVWWRKFSGMPSNFSTTDIAQTVTGEQQVSVQFNFPWGIDKLETITIFGASKLETITQKLGISCIAKEGRKSVTPNMVVCKTCLDLAVLAYLSDAYEEVERQGTTRTVPLVATVLVGDARGNFLVLRLHYRLAPYKVSIVAGAGGADMLKTLNDLAGHLMKELKKSGISVLINPDLQTQASLESQFVRFDEMGIPYIIVLNENTLKTGIIGLRNRDTTLKEQVHITELKQKLLLYL